MCSVALDAGGLEMLMRRCMRRIVVAVHAEKDADEPRPAPTGSVARVLKLKAGLFCMVGAAECMVGGER
jgi:hypothetical protein